MPTKQSSARPGVAPQCTAAQDTRRARRVNALKDAVYREMLRLESRLPGSEMLLAVSLLRAVVTLQELDDADFSQWVRHVCPVGLKMIDTSVSERVAQARAQG